MHPTEFRKLMQDPESVNHLRDFLRLNGLEDLINFYFSCCSVRCPENRTNIVRLVKAIYNKFINRADCVVHNHLSEPIRAKLIDGNRKIRQIPTPTDLSEEFYLDLFEDAKNFIYTKLSGSIGDNFVASDFYRKRILSEQTSSDPQPTDYSNLPNAEGSPIYGASSVDDEKHFVIGIDSNNNDKHDLSLTSSTTTTAAASTTQSRNPESLSSETNSTYNDICNNSDSYPVRSRNTIAILETLDEHHLEAEIETITNGLDGTCVDDIPTVAPITNSTHPQSQGQVLSSTSQAIVNDASSTSGGRSSTNSSTSQMPPKPPMRSSSPSWDYPATYNAQNRDVEKNFMSKTLGRSSRNRSSHNNRSSSPLTTIGDMTTAKFYPPSSIDGIIGLNAKNQLNTFHVSSVPHPYQPPNPYHVTTNNIIPNSVRDSEIQSGTSSDTYSIITTRSSERSYAKKAYSYAFPNRNQPTTNPDVNFRAITAENEGKFFEELIRRLSKVKDQLDQEMNFHRRLRELESDSSSSTGAITNRARQPMMANSGRAQNNEFGKNLRETFKNRPFAYPTTENESQKILDSHCAQVFDSTPNSGTPTNALQAPQPIPPQFGVAPNPNWRFSQFAGPPYIRAGMNGTVGAQGPVVGPGQQQQYPVVVNGGRAPNTGVMNGAAMGAEVQVVITVKFEEEDYPYKFKLNGPNILLATFKAHVRNFKKGKSFNYFFKRKATDREKKESGSSFFLEQLEADSMVIPVLDGNKVFAEAKECARRS